MLVNWLSNNWWKLVDQRRAFVQGDQRGGGWVEHRITLRCWPEGRHQAEDKSTAWTSCQTEPFQGISRDLWGRPESELLCSVETKVVKRGSLCLRVWMAWWMAPLLCIWPCTVEAESASKSSDCRRSSAGGLSLVIADHWGEANFPSKTLNPNEKENFRSFFWISCRWCEEKSPKLDLQKKSDRGVCHDDFQDFAWKG